MKRTSLLLILASSAAAMALLYGGFPGRENAGSSLADRMRNIVPVSKDRIEIPCQQLAARQPLVLLALGQSNAGNHGPLHRQQAITLIADGQCLISGDPLPGATGSGGSIWQRLPDLLSASHARLPIVLSVLAVDASTIDEWTDAHSPLRKRLIAHIDTMQRLGLPPQLILWQQGEADARRGSSQQAYSAGLERLRSMLDRAGTRAPIMLARSTRCLSPGNPSIRAAIAAVVSINSGFRLGPDTDTLSGKTMRDGCHFTAEGLDSAARMWAETIDAEIPTLGMVRHKP